MRKILIIGGAGFIGYHLTKKLKNKFACGGTYDETSVELQGDHAKHAKGELVRLGFTPDSIED